MNKCFPLLPPGLVCSLVNQDDDGSWARQQPSSAHHRISSGHCCTSITAPPALSSSQLPTPRGEARRGAAFIGAVWFLPVGARRRHCSIWGINGWGGAARLSRRPSRAAGHAPEQIETSSDRISLVFLRRTWPMNMDCGWRCGPFGSAGRRRRCCL